MNLKLGGRTSRSLVQSSSILLCVTMVIFIVNDLHTVRLASQTQHTLDRPPLLDEPVAMSMLGDDQQPSLEEVLQEMKDMQDGKVIWDPVDSRLSNAIRELVEGVTHGAAENLANPAVVELAQVVLEDQAPVLENIEEKAELPYLTALQEEGNVHADRQTEALST
eukprot:Colp12_sorted_trinity150504_noHs@20550